MRNLVNWRIHRALFALNNAQAYGRLKYLLNSDTMSYVAKRIRAMVRYTDLTRARVRYADSYHPKRGADMPNDANQVLGPMDRSVDGRGR